MYINLYDSIFIILYKNLQESVATNSRQTVLQLLEQFNPEYKSERIRKYVHICQSYCTNKSGIT